MTINEFNRIRHEARIYGNLVERHQAEMMFSVGEQTMTIESYEYQGFLVKYQDGEFACMAIKATGEEIQANDCTHNNLDGYSISELEQIIKDAEKLIKNQKNKEANIAIQNFVKAWNELQKHEQVRIRVTGQKTHFHDNISNIQLSILPLD